MLLILLVAALSAPGPAVAATINVNEDADESNTDLDCSVREAILSAGNDAPFDACEPGAGADVINLQATTYNLTGSLVVSNNEVTFNGAGQGSTIFDADDTDRVLTVSGPADPVVLEDLTIRDGLAPSGGGGIKNFGDLTLSGVLVTSNEITGNLGGGINTSGTLDVQDSSIDGNVGRGIHNQGGMLTVTDSSVSNNQDSTTDPPLGGGIENTGPNGTAVIEGSVIDGNGDTGIASLANLTVTDSMVTDNVGGTGAFGGGISILSTSASHTTVLNGVVISGNSANTGGGGGIANGSSSPSAAVNLSITDSTISGNTAQADGGGLDNFPDGGATVIERTTISGNDVGATACGGGIGNGNVTSNPETVIVNSTISGNTGGSCGGGIHNYGDPVTILFSTISGNQVTAGTGGIQNGGTVTMGSTILANNTGPNADCDSGVGIASAGYNLIEGGASCTITGDTTGNLIGVDPVLEPLAPNGGPTLTHELLPGSPAINAANPACPPPAIDQRGVVRQPGRVCDIGAFEVAEEPVPQPAAEEPAADTAPPDTTITKAPKRKSKKKRGTFEFSGTDARAVAGFECSLDGGPFAACTSPHTVKVKKGKHTLSVRAIDQAGNVDATPATDDWKVKKKRR